MGFVQTNNGMTCYMGEQGSSAGEATFVGTDDSQASGSRVMFQSAGDANVTVSVSQGEDGVVVATIGVYYT